LRVGEGAEPVVVLLAGGVEEAEGVGFVSDPGGELVVSLLLPAYFA
jgi:hypothetical protein